MRTMSSTGHCMDCSRPALSGDHCCGLCQVTRGRTHSRGCEEAQNAPFQAHSDTSRASARKLSESGSWSSKRGRTWRMVRDAGQYGMTSGEMARANGDDHSNAWAPSLTTLHQDGHVACLEEKRASPLSGHAQHVYVLHENVNERPVIEPFMRECPHCGEAL